MKLDRAYPPCPGLLCGARLMPGRVLCAACWERVPKEIQELVAETWRADSPSEAHRNAIKAAVRTVTLPLTD